MGRIAANAPDSILRTGRHHGRGWRPAFLAFPAAAVDAACDCGTPYMPAGQRAAAAVAANPHLSDRAIARELGVGNKTVSRARQTVSGDTVEDEPRIGLDGNDERDKLTQLEPLPTSILPVTYHSTFVDCLVTGDDMASTGKFVCYYRVSTARQGKSGLGLDGQRAAVATYLNGGNWSIVDEYTEVESGKRSDRPALDKALAAARLHRCPLVVSKVDRLTRSVAFLSRLLEAGVDVRFADLPQIEGATGRFLLQQMVAVAELEAGMISARTKAALAAAKRRGVVLGGDRGVAPSAKVRRQAIAALQTRADQRAADVAETIRKLQAGGAESLRAIAAGLNEAGIPTPRGGGSWSAVQVQRTLARLN